MLSIAHTEPSVDDLGEEIATLAAALWAGTARFLALLGVFDEREDYARWGIGSSAQWLAWHCGLSPVAAREYVRVARALTALPHIAAAFGSGELSYSKVRAITRIACDQTEALLLEWARHGTASQLERLVRGYRRARANEDPLRLHVRRSVRWFFDDDGSLELRARLSPEDGALLVRALQTAEGQVIHSDVSAEAPDEPEDPDASNPWEQRRADALVALAESYIAAGDRPLDAEARTLVVLHLDQGSRCELQPGGPIAVQTAMRLACDAGLVRMAEHQTIGRRTRVVPAAMRRALRRRDQGCRFPGCQARRVDAHHVRHWSRGGETSLANLVLLCRRHHRLVHEGGFRVEMPDSGEPEFYRPDGKPLQTHPARGGALSAGGFGPLTCATKWDGRRPDYGIAVEGLFAMKARAPSPSISRRE